MSLRWRFVGSIDYRCFQITSILLPIYLFQNQKKGATVVETAESRSSLIQKFRFQTGLSHPEAKYYLSGAEFDLQRALTEYRADAAWDAKQGEK